MKPVARRDKKNAGGTTMTSGFQNQNPNLTGSLPKTEPKAQHGQKPSQDCVKMKEKRSFEPKPGH
jgi:hypothetical protein